MEPRDSQGHQALEVSPALMGHLVSQPTPDSKVPPVSRALLALMVCPVTPVTQDSLGPRVPLVDPDLRVKEGTREILGHKEGWVLPGLQAL